MKALDTLEEPRTQVHVKRPSQTTFLLSPGLGPPGQLLKDDNKCLLGDSEVLFKHQSARPPFGKSQVQSSSHLSMPPQRMF